MTAAERPSGSSPAPAMRDMALSVGGETVDSTADTAVSGPTELFVGIGWWV